MPELRLGGLFTWRSVARLGYLPLESFLSVESFLDEATICIDPLDGDEEEHKLAYALAEKFNKVRVVNFVWPDNVPGDGTRIGIASAYTLNQSGANYCLNVQADEIYSPQLSEWLGANWKELVRKFGIECFSIKVLNLEHNMSQYQGGHMTRVLPVRVSAQMCQNNGEFLDCCGRPMMSKLVTAGEELSRRRSESDLIIQRSWYTIMYQR